MPGAPAEFPSGDDTCDTLPYEATLAATPEIKENLISPVHNADAKRDAYQRKLVKERVEGTSSVEVPTFENKSTNLESADGLESKDETGTKSPKKKTTRKKIDAKEEQFLTSEQEAR